MFPTVFPKLLLPPRHKVGEAPLFLKAALLLQNVRIRPIQSQMRPAPLSLFLSLWFEAGGGCLKTQNRVANSGMEKSEDLRVEPGWDNV